MAESSVCVMKTDGKVNINIFASPKTSDHYKNISELYNSTSHTLS